MGRIYDISLGIAEGGLHYPGNPEIRITPVQRIAEGASANVSRIDFGSHTLTHVDAERHFDDAAPGVDAIPLETLMGPAVVLAFDDAVRAVTADALRAHDLGGATRVLLRTRNSGFNTEPGFRPDFTYLAPDGADYLVAQGVKLVGIDYLSIEQFHSGHHRTHRTLLGHGVVIVEGLALAAVPPGRYDLVCLPLKLVGLDGAPARAVLIAS